MNLHIETKRLIIRNLQIDDWEDVVSWCTDAQTMHYIPIGVLTPQEVKEIVSESPDEETECYASEAAQAVLAYGFQHQKLHRIIATCQPDNPPSWKRTSPSPAMLHPPWGSIHRFPSCHV